MRKTIYVTCFILLGFLPQVLGQTTSQSWADVKANSSGQLVITYSENSPFIYENSEGELAGIEYDLLQEFTLFVDRKYGVKLELKWEHLRDFGNLLDTLKNTSRPIVGLASISITKERKKEFKLSKAYMPDIEIIVSSGVFGSAGTLAEFAKMVRNNRALTVSKSTFESNILELKRDYFPKLNIEYVAHVDLVIEKISSSNSYWGYVSLPNYLSYYKNGIDISRQRFFMVENAGLAFATPLHSDWDKALNAFINDPSFVPLMDSLIEKYLGSAFNKVVGSISHRASDIQPNNAAKREVGVLTLERELQDLKLQQNEDELSRKNLFIYLAISGIMLVLVALFALYRLVRLKVNTNKSLSEKNEFIKSQNLELNSLNIEKNELIGIVAHDLKNPLASAMSVAELFSSEEITEDQSEYLSLIHRSLHRMNGLISKILEIKVLESKSLKMNYAIIDVKVLIEQVISSLKIQSDNKNIEVIAELDDLKANIDKSLTEQIFDNLLSNAIKFSNKKTQINIALIETENGFRFEIQDHGPGISEDDQPLLFKKFQKLTARPTAGESSTGLGLSIVKKYVDTMKGTINYETELGKGTKFIVEINNN